MRGETLIQTNYDEVAVVVGIIDDYNCLGCHLPLDVGGYPMIYQK